MGSLYRMPAEWGSGRDQRGETHGSDSHGSRFSGSITVCNCLIMDSHGRNVEGRFLLRTDKGWKSFWNVSLISSYVNNFPTGMLNLISASAPKEQMAHTVDIKDII